MHSRPFDWLWLAWNMSHENRCPRGSWKTRHTAVVWLLRNGQIIVSSGSLNVQRPEWLCEYDKYRTPGDSRRDVICTSQPKLGKTSFAQEVFLCELDLELAWLIYLHVSGHYGVPTSSVPQLNFCLSRRGKPSVLFFVHLGVIKVQQSSVSLWLSSYRNAGGSHWEVSWEQPNIVYAVV